MQYRVYLLDSKNRIAGVEAFYAIDDDEAAEMALDLYSLSSDAVAGYELWRGAARFIQALDRPLPTHPNLKGMNIDRQARMLDLEEKLQSNFASLRKSERLIAAAKALLEKPY